MANYYGVCRSNKFKVKKKCKDRFDEIMCNLGFQIETDKDGVTLFLDDACGIPTTFFDSDTSEDVPVDWSKEVAPLLEEGEVIHLVESGAEKLRWLGGQAFFLRSDGKCKHIDINHTPISIVRFMEKFKKVPTRPHW